MFKRFESDSKDRLVHPSQNQRSITTQQVSTLMERLQLTILRTFGLTSKEQLQEHIFICQTHI